MAMLFVAMMVHIVLILSGGQSNIDAADKTVRGWLVIGWNHINSRQPLSLLIGWHFNIYDNFTILCQTSWEKNFDNWELCLDLQNDKPCHTTQQLYYPAERDINLSTCDKPSANHYHLWLKIRWNRVTKKFNSSCCSDSMTTTYWHA